MGCGVSGNVQPHEVVNKRPLPANTKAVVSQDTLLQSSPFLSPEEDKIPAPDGDFHPNYSEFPSHVTLRHENVRYWKWKEKHSGAKPLHPGCPDPDIVRKKHFLQMSDFVAADKQALLAPHFYLTRPLHDIVSYLIGPFKDDLNKVRVLFRWFCAQNLDTIANGGPAGSAQDYLYKIYRGMSHSGVFLEMCRMAKLECEEIFGATKDASYKLGGDVDFNFQTSWNAIKINKTWHLLNANFASHHVKLENTEWELLDDNGEGYAETDKENQEAVNVYAYNDFYFLTDPEEFIYDHFPNKEGWQLLARPVNKQEFQGMAYLRQGFFEMSLGCLQERKCTLHSQCQESMLKLGLPSNKTRNFMYQFWKSSKDGNWDFNEQPMARFVYLEKHEGKLMAKVMYPVRGRYKLSLYTKDTHQDSSFDYTWVADYLLICKDRQKQCHALPVNSRFEWGPGHDTERLGMTAVSHPDGTIETDDGEAEVVFSLNRPVDSTAELRNDTQAEELLQQSLMHRIEDCKLIINARLQAPGMYALDIYAKQKGEGGVPALVCTYLVSSSSRVLEPFKFPSLHQQAAGPTDAYSKFHTVPVSHKTAYFTSRQGSENMVFQYSLKLSFQTELLVDHGKGMVKTENHTLIEQTDASVTFKVRFPRAGIYNLKIYAKQQADSEPYQVMYNYIIRVPVRMKYCSPFPAQYLRLGCKLDGLESGYLVAGKDISVNVVIPKAKNVVAIKNGQYTHLSEGSGHNWSGEVNTGKAGESLKLSAQFKGDDLFQNLFEYEVKATQVLDKMRQFQTEQFKTEQENHDNRELVKKKKAAKLKDLQKELKEAIIRENLIVLQNAVDKVERRGYTNKLREDYTKAKEKIGYLERAEKMKMSIVEMNQRTMAEIRSYNWPPEGVHEVMMAALLLMNKHEGFTKNWKACQARCNAGTLSKKVAAFNVKRLNPEIAARAKALLLGYRIEDIALKSAGAAAFYRWVVAMTDELDKLTDGSVTKAKPALLKRQKEIFKAKKRDSE